MSFTESQRNSLTARLHKRHVRTRATDGAVLNYVTGWHAIAEANRIFGHDAWDRWTIETRCIWSERRHGQFACLYTAKVRVSVRAGPVVIVRDGLGTGYGRKETESAAHEIAFKASETDATKRALATFGNPFGLALYELSGRRRTNTAPPNEDDPKNPSQARATFTLRHLDGGTKTFSKPDELASAMVAIIAKLDNLKDVYKFWEMNLDGLLALRRSAKTPDKDPVPAILERLKARGREVSVMYRETQDRDAQGEVEPLPMAFPKPKRHRDKEHLRFVARHPCVVCGRTPAQAHHLRFAQPRAMSSKVSDEYTVPLCTTHHDALHRTGDEPAWWARHNLKPLEIAARLWTAEDKTDQADLDPLIAGRSPALRADKTNGASKT